ncbi:hypothetical protein DFH06DRAFT_982408 [Mycena polygramma]|nr:hypothetical protein DFH06DRAFT_982408 [Mycena polygramma]
MTDFSSWGSQWPRHHNIVTRPEMGDLDDGDELFLDVGIADGFDYWCLEDIGEVAKALAMPLHLEDILVVRQQYRFSIGILNNYCSRMLVITGHPGIGKTTFLIYLLLHRLQHRLPTAVQVDYNNFFVFDENGATVYDAHARVPEASTRLQRCWALCDSNGLVPQPCASIQAHAHRIILTASPNPNRWKQMRKQLRGITLILGLPTVMEIAAAAKELGLDTSSTLGHVGRWGPSLRTTVALIRDPICATEHEIFVQMEAMALGRFTPSTYITESEVGNMLTCGGSSLFFLGQRSSDTVVGLPTASLTVPTKHLAEILDKHTTQLTAEQSFDLFCMLSPHSLTQTGAGWTHEKAMHKKMASATEIRLFRGQEEMKVKTTDNVLPGTAGALERAMLGTMFYWMPLAIDLPGVDSVLGDARNNFFTFQAVVTDGYRDVEEGITKVWNTVSPDCRKGRQWHVVLVCNSVAQAESLVAAFPRHMLRLGQQKVNVQVWGYVL